LVFAILHRVFKARFFAHFEFSQVKALSRVDQTLTVAGLTIIVVDSFTLVGHVIGLGQRTGASHKGEESSKSKRNVAQNASE
jgi:hypothetical protein